MSPLGEEEYVADLARILVRAVVVGPNVLGTINLSLQTLITAARLRRGAGDGGHRVESPRPPSVADASLATNRRELAQRCVPPILAEVPSGRGFRRPGRLVQAGAKGFRDLGI